MDPNQVRRLAEQFAERLLRYERAGEAELDALVELFADDAELVNPALQLAGQRRVGREQVRRFWQAYRDSLGEPESEFFRVTTSADAAGLFWTTRASGRDGETAIEYDGATLLVFDEDERIRRFRAHFHLDELADHAGASDPTPASEPGDRTPSPPPQPLSYG